MKGSGYRDEVAGLTGLEEDPEACIKVWKLKCGDPAMGRGQLGEPRTVYQGRTGAL